MKHACHICNIGSIQILKTDKCFQIRATKEPIFCTRDSGAVGKGLVEDNGVNRFCHIVPASIDRRTKRIDHHCFAVCRPLIVIAEFQCCVVIDENGIGLWTLRWLRLTIHRFFYLPADIVDLLDHVADFLFVSLMGIKHVAASIHKIREFFQHPRLNIAVIACPAIQVISILQRRFQFLPILCFFARTTAFSCEITRI